MAEAKNRFLEGRIKAKAKRIAKLHGLHGDDAAAHIAAESKPRPSRDNFYVNPKELADEITKYKRTKIVSDALGSMFLRIAMKYATKPCFSGYSYKDDFIGDAIVRMLEQVGKIKLGHPIEKLVSKNAKLITDVRSHTSAFFNFPDDPSKREPTLELKPHGARSGRHLTAELGRSIKMLSRIEVYPSGHATLLVHASADGKAWELVGKVTGKSVLVLKTELTMVKFVKVSNDGEKAAQIHGLRVHGFVTPNPFSYLTQICYNCFVSKINKEKKFSEVKEGLARESISVLESSENIYVKKHTDSGDSSPLPEEMHGTQEA